MPLSIAGAWESGQLANILLGRPGTTAIDYQIYRSVVHLGLTHGWSSIYDRHLQEQLLLPLWPRSAWPFWWHSSQPFWAPFVSPPPAAWIAAPLEMLPAHLATLVWLVLLGAASITTVALIAPDSWSARLRYSAVLVLTWAPLLAVVSANLVVLVGLVLVAAWRLLDRRRDLLAGVVLSLATIKPQVMIAVPLLLLMTGRWRATAAWAVASAALLLVSAVSLGRGGLADYFLLSRFVAGFPAEQHLSLLRVPGSAAGTICLGVAIAAATAVVAYAKRDRGPAIAVALGTVASLLLAPYLNVEDYVLLVPAGLLLLRARRSLVDSVLAVGLVLSATPASQGYFVPSAVLFGLVLVAFGASRLASSTGPAEAEPGEARVRRTPSPGG